MTIMKQSNPLTKPTQSPATNSGSPLAKTVTLKIELTFGLVLELSSWRCLRFFLVCMQAGYRLDAERRFAKMASA